jgi:hypothetical protein
MTASSRARNERGAALILAIAFLVVVGGIGAALVSSITSGANQRATLDDLRDRQYAADGAIEEAIAQLRREGGTSAAFTACGPYTPPPLNGVAIRVVCSNVPTVTEGGYLQRNVIFTACLDSATNPTCARGRPIMRAQVNFEAVGDPLEIRRTWVQSWSVNS